MSILQKIKGLFKGHPKEVIPKKYIKSLIKPDATIVEAGASTGEDTIELSQLFPNGKIYAFEPLPHIYKELVQNIATLPNVTTIEKALSDSTGSSIINISSNNSSSSLLAPKEHLIDHPEITFEKQVKVATVTLDDFAKNYNLRHIDFLWLDLQGFEFQTLKASKDIFKTVKLLHTEVSLVKTYEGVVLYDEFKNWLESLGFRVLKEALPYKDMGNVLFIRD